MGRPNVNWNIGIALDKQSTYTSKTIKAGIPFALQITGPNTKYIIKYDFDLGGESVEIPENCILEFDGGSVSNGTLVGDGTQIYAEKVAIFSEITIGGEWNVPYITTAWFKEAESEDDVICQAFNLANSEVDNILTVEKGTYWVNCKGSDKGAIEAVSNTEYRILGTIRLRPNNITYHGFFFLVKECDNVKITGGGSLYGDKESHIYYDGNTYPSGYIYGFNLSPKPEGYSSNEHNHVLRIDGNTCSKIIIDGINIYDAVGDGIDLTHGESGESHEIIIRNFHIENCRRQGITATNTNVIIENGSIKGIRGTAPEAGIDIENSSTRNHGSTNTVIKNVLIDDCTYGISTNEGASSDDIYNVFIHNVDVKNVQRGIALKKRLSNVHIENCTFDIKIRGSKTIPTNTYGAGLGASNVIAINCDFNITVPYLKPGFDPSDTYKLLHYDDYLTYESSETEEDIEAFMGSFDAINTGTVKTTKNKMLQNCSINTNVSLGIFRYNILANSCQITCAKFTDIAELSLGTSTNLFTNNTITVEHGGIRLYSGVFIANQIKVNGSLELRYVKMSDNTITFAGDETYYPTIAIDSAVRAYLYALRGITFKDNYISFDTSFDLETETVFLRVPTTGVAMSEVVGNRLVTTTPPLFISELQGNTEKNVIVKDNSYTGGLFNDYIIGYQKYGDSVPAPRSKYSKGMFYWDDTNGIPLWFNGTSWVKADGTSPE